MTKSEDSPYSLPETFCPLPWVQISSMPQGHKMACCMSRHHVEGVSFEDFVDSPYMVNLRRDLATGVKNSNCNVCWSFEEKGLNSLRRDQLRKALHSDGEYGTYLLLDESRKSGFQIKQIEKLDFRLGTTCNLKCRMCNATNSSKIWGEYVQHKDKLSNFPSFYSGVELYYQGEQKPAELNDLLSVSKNLDRINISGGEPNLSPFLVSYLENLVAQGRSKNVGLKINTNAVVNSPRLFSVFPHFRRVEMFLSIDGTGSVQEYIRHPSKWSEIEKSVLEMKEYFGKFHPSRYRILAAPTYQALNVLNLKDIVVWCEEMGIEWSLTNKILDPEFMRVDVLPSHIRLLAAERLESFLRERPFSKESAMEIGLVIHHLRSVIDHDEARLSTFLDYNHVLDEIRGEAFAGGCPELHSLLSEYMAGASHSE